MAAKADPFDPLVLDGPTDPPEDVKRTTSVMGMLFGKNTCDTHTNNRTPLFSSWCVASMALASLWVLYGDWHRLLSGGRLAPTDGNRKKTAAVIFAAVLMDVLMLCLFAVHAVRCQYLRGAVVCSVGIVLVTVGVQIFLGMEQLGRWQTGTGPAVQVAVDPQPTSTGG